MHFTVQAYIDCIHYSTQNSRIILNLIDFNYTINKHYTYINNRN